MRTTLLAAGALGALLTLSACGGGYGSGYGDHAVAVYYDGAFGPYTEGYWGPDTYFYYRGGDGRFIRDENNHFRRQTFEGARMYHPRPYVRDRDGG